MYLHIYIYMYTNWLVFHRHIYICIFMCERIVYVWRQREWGINIDVTSIYLESSSCPWQNTFWNQSWPDSEAAYFVESRWVLTVRLILIRSSILMFGFISRIINIRTSIRCDSHDNIHINHSICMIINVYCYV